MEAPPVKPSVVAVLDVGKTNKKVSLYDRQFNVLAEERTTIEPKDFNGLEVEDTEALLSWFVSAVKKLSAQADIRSIAITTHGATLALLGEDGKLSHPVISYSAAKGAEVQEEFYSEFGDRASLHKATCTPDVGFANMAKILYYAKSRLPEVWAKTKHALFYTSYLAYELTGVMGMEPTYVGNHCYLWDFAKNDWSDVAKKLGADALFPSEFSAPWKNLGPVKPEIAEACGLSPDCQVAQGIHDSNANFLPYLAQGYENFLLNSTGTWCVLMRKATSINLSPEEIGAKVFFNIDAQSNPVRTCIFPAGMEYDTFRAYSFLSDQSDAEAVRRVASEKNIFVIPGVLPDASAFPGAAPRIVTPMVTLSLDNLRRRTDMPMTSYEQDYFAALNLSLALATRKMLAWCDVNKGCTVFIEGGFAKNKTYCELLATMCPDQTFVLTNVKEGTSFGAALTGWMLAENLSLEAIGKEFSIQTTPVERVDFGDLQGYEAAFMKLVNQ
jgi:sugar (pentulose or hexulose) kinase